MAMVAMPALRTKRSALGLRNQAALVWLVAFALFAAACSAGPDAVGTEDLVDAMTPVPTPAAIVSIPPPNITVNPDISSMTARFVTSTSPDGQWRAEALLASFPGEIAYDFARVTVSRTDFSSSWVPYKQLNEYGGLGTGYISDFYWSADGRFLYFKHTATSDGCGYPFTTRLHQIDLAEESLSEIPLAGMGFGEITMSPDAGRMAYRTEDGVLVYELATGSTRILPYPWPEGFGYLVGWNAWSPEGNELAFTITEPLCDSPEPPRNTLHLIDLESGDTHAPGPDERWIYIPDRLVADPVPTAALALHEFLSSLYWAARGGLGDYTYARAVALYGGSYETLIDLNPDLAPTDSTSLLRSACEVNGYQCLRLRDVISSHAWQREYGAWVVSFTVYLEDLEGGIFARGPCCAEETGVPQVLFEFSVAQSGDGTFRVLDLPPYVP